MGRYHLLSKIAQGGMGEVFRAKAVGAGGFQKTVAFKRIHPQLAKFPEFVNMFLNEARLAAVLDHPNIVQIFDMGQEEGSYFIAMEMVDGTSLQGLAKAAADRGERLPVDEVLKIASLACDGLAYAHAFTDESGTKLNLVHRDISPDNILLSRSGAVKVADFGIAKAATVNAETRAGTTKGKVPYLSPEALMSKPVDGRADLFALGVVIFEVLAGVRPFDGKGDMGMMRAIVYLPPRSLRELRPDAPPELEQLLSRALAKDPGARFASASAMGEALEQLLVRRGRVVNANALAELVQRLVPSEPHLEEHPTTPARPGPVGRQALVAAASTGPTLEVPPPPADEDLPAPASVIMEARTAVRANLPPTDEPATAVVNTLASALAEEAAAGASEAGTQPANVLPADLLEAPTFAKMETAAPVPTTEPSAMLDSGARAREQARRQEPFEAKKRRARMIAILVAALLGVGAFTGWVILHR